jgi:DNA-binding GntR family transcriptional regulator
MSIESTEQVRDSRVLRVHVVDKLEQLVLSGRYRPGEKLREQLLASELGVSRAPLREAIRTLEGRRLLERTPRSGVQVVGLSVDKLAQILSTREALEGMAARQAAENMTVAEVNALRRTVDRFKAHPADVAGAVFSGGPDNDFHRLIADGSRNCWLADILVKDVYSLLRLYRLQAALRPDVADSAAEHTAIIDCIHARDGDGAEAAMRKHLRQARNRTLELGKP